MVKNRVKILHRFSPRAVLAVGRARAWAVVVVEVRAWAEAAGDGNSMPESIIIACGTDDGVNFTDEHFGSAKYYLLYSLDPDTGETRFLEKQENTTPEEETHGDPKKARSISGLMDGVDVLVGKAMGTNITRMRKKFVPIISREMDISKTLGRLGELTDDIRENMNRNQTQERDILFIR